MNLQRTRVADARGLARSIGMRRVPERLLPVRAVGRTAAVDMGNAALLRTAAAVDMRNAALFDVRHG